MLDTPNFGRSSRRIALRDAKIIQSRARGKSWIAIARDHGLSVRGCQRIVEAWRKDGLGVDDVIDPMAEVRALIELLGQAVEDFATVEERTKHDGYRIAATREKIDAATQRFQLLQVLGLIPRPHVVSAERAMQAMLKEFAAIVERHNVPDEALQEILDLSERRLADPGVQLVSVV